MEVVPLIFDSTFRGKVVLVTGHTGFKGSWLTAWLKQLGANVIGLSLEPKSFPSHFHVADLAKGINDLRVDIRNQSDLQQTILEHQPDFVFHLAAQSLVMNSYENPRDTWDTNVMGTLNVLEALRKLNKKCAAVIVTSDKCYDNAEWIWGYRETDALGGSDPYSASKAAAELVIHSHIKSFFPRDTSKVRIASARAGNVIGGGDWAEDRIIPDCVKAWSRGEEVELRSPHATRPWQHVLEPLSGYLNLAVALSQRDEIHGEAFNFGPQSLENHDVLSLVSEMGLHWNRVKWKVVAQPSTERHESSLLKLNCDKALHYLKWQAVLGFKETVKLTAEWYKSFYDDSAEIGNLTKKQINNFCKAAKELGIPWAL
jgi:CDP-glucose 4,6-dehydratase